VESEKQQRSAMFRSKLAPLLRAFLLDKRARGYLYTREVLHLRQLDRFLLRAGIKEAALSQPVVELWLSSTLNRRASTHRKRVIVARQLAAFLQLHGCPAHRPVLPLTPRREDRSAARIFSRHEMRSILKAADCLPYSPQSPQRHIVMPEVFRVLYGCGLRIGEATRLSVADVDLAQGVLKVRQGKFRRDRLVPLAPALRRRLQRYAEALGTRSPEEFFFPSPRGRRYGNQGMYAVFRHLLQQSGIVHRGRGRGPRLHEIRHTMAVHRLEGWYRAGEDLNAKLPLLATYLGHRTTVGTAAYLQLTQALFADLATRLERSFGHVIPKVVRS
jgi:integrase/recombinase XerD